MNSSELERIAQALVESLGQADRIAAELYVAAGRITRLAALVGSLPDPGAWATASMLNAAAAKCVLAANLLRQAGKIGADWARQAVWRAG
ncbi:hypothetical protein [Nonomuraea endophytica]|uniref:DhaL domain-containing protein n=1 Tax=Nonomuraea endophytica TaxID=714136 RepID=A0A7W8A0H5_9ACTN|nr:hypothetical protein [Nonomuraea endophytica]MBB5076173.1 hypothetical protein [Nonomuraea endophytica]